MRTVWGCFSESLPVMKQSWDSPNLDLFFTKLVYLVIRIINPIESQTWWIHGTVEILNLGVILLFVRISNFRMLNIKFPVFLLLKWKDGSRCQVEASNSCQYIKRFITGTAATTLLFIQIPSVFAEFSRTDPLLIPPLFRLPKHSPSLQKASYSKSHPIFSNCMRNDVT